MKNTRNRLTPFLLIIFICLIWVLIGVVSAKLIQRNKDNRDIKKLKLDDELVQELYSYINDNDIILFSSKNYKVTNLPNDFIIKKAFDYMTIENIEFLPGNRFVIDYNALDGSIKRAFGPEFKYDFNNLDISVKTEFSLEENNLIFNIKYDKKTNSYIGTYKEDNSTNEVLVNHELVRATMDKNIDFKIGYIFYKNNGKYQICNNYKCDKIVKEVDSIEDYKYDQFITISLKKSNDDSYYYEYNS